MEILIAIILIAMTLIFFIMRKGTNIEDEPVQTKKAAQKQMETPQEKPKAKEEKADIPQATSDNKECLLNSFREVKEMRNLRFLDDGKTFIFCDEKRIIIGQVVNFSEKNIKFIKYLNIPYLASINFC